MNIMKQIKWNKCSKRISPKAQRNRELGAFALSQQLTKVITGLRSDKKLWFHCLFNSWIAAICTDFWRLADVRKLPSIMEKTPVLLFGIPDLWQQSHFTNLQKKKFNHPAILIILKDVSLSGVVGRTAVTWDRNMRGLKSTPVSPLLSQNTNFPLLRLLFRNGKSPRTKRSYTLSMFLCRYGGEDPWHP